MRVVVTGSTGFLGQRLCRQLTSLGRQVIGVGRSEAKAFQFPGFEYHVADLSNPVSLFPGDPPEDGFLLVHLAWDIAHRSDLQSQTECLSQLGRLIEYWTPRGLCGIVSAGSAEEFGSREGILSETTSPGERRSAYGWSKASAASLLKDWSSMTGIPATWLRPFTVYGPSQRGRMLIPYAIDQALNGQHAQFTAGIQQRDFVFVDDVVDGFVRAIHRFQNNDSSIPTNHAAGFEAINLGSGQPIAIRDILHLISTKLQAEHLFDLGAIPTRPNEPMLQVAGTEHARDILGWHARTRLNEGIQEVIDCAIKEYQWAA